VNQHDRRHALPTQGCCLPRGWAIRTLHCKLASGSCWRCQDFQQLASCPVAASASSADSAGFALVCPLLTRPQLRGNTTMSRVDLKLCHSSAAASCPAKLWLIKPDPGSALYKIVIMTLRAQGPTISPVFTPANGGGAAAEHGFYAVTICVPKKKLYASVKALRKVRRSCKLWRLKLLGVNMTGVPAPCLPTRSCHKKQCAGACFVAPTCNKSSTDRLCSANSKIRLDSGSTALTWLLWWNLCAVMIITCWSIAAGRQRRDGAADDVHLRRGAGAVAEHRPGSGPAGERHCQHRIVQSDAYFAQDSGHS